jgi:TolB-like protein/Tfp pilus assembly protein PilF
LGNLIAELGRRNVFRVAGVYAVVGWLLAQVATLLETSLELPTWFDAVILSALLIGFPVALILAWAFELTPEGVKRTADAAQSGDVAPPFRKTDLAILAGVVLVIGLFVAERMMPPPFPTLQGSGGDSTAGQGADSRSGAAGAESRQAAAADSRSAQGAGGTAPSSTQATPAPAASIAVLPFADLSPDGDQQYFSDGVAEEILNVLTRIDGLKVASRTSSFQFRSTAAGVPTIARELGVRLVLEGSVRKAGDVIRITAQLVDAEMDAHLWSETFDRPLTTETVFAIQDEIAAAIVAALREEIGVDVGQAAPAAVPTADVDAYELYLQGRTLFQSRRNLDEADRFLEQAIERDPQFADALAIRAAIYLFGGEYGALTGEEVEARRTGRAFAEQALAINPENSLALAVTALSHYFDHMEGHGSEGYENIFAAFDRALKLDPNNSNALNWLGIVHAFVGENEQAAAVHRRCIETDPALSACHSNLAMELVSLGRRDEANAVIDVAVDTGAFAVGPGQMLLLAELRRRDAFLQLALNVPGLRGFRKFNALYDELIGATEDPRIAAEVKALLVENDASARAYVLLNALGDHEAPPLLTLGWMDVMTPYRRSPEFKEHARASGLPDYWRRHGFPPQCRPLGESDFECE